MEPKIINVLGMELEEWKYKSCTAHFACGENWATLYDIHSTECQKGHASELLKEAKIYYENNGKIVGGSPPLNSTMKYLYHKFNYKVYEE